MMVGVVRTGEGETTEREEWEAEVLERIPPLDAKGRKSGSKRTPERALVIIGALRKAASREAAATQASMTYNTLWRWMAESADMTELVEQAEGAGEASLVTEIRDAARRTWQAAAWLLERKYPNRWAKRKRTDISIEARRLAETVAAETGLTVEEVLADANDLIARHMERMRRETG